MTAFRVAMKGMDSSQSPRVFANTIPHEPMNGPFDARRQVQAYCQSLVDSGEAQWRVNDDGYAELHMRGGETYLFGELGLTRLK
ncbi:hypothetical protein [Achromobacter pestifer]